jgi:hypothetical protein
MKYNISKSNGLSHIAIYASSSVLAEQKLFEVIENLITQFNKGHPHKEGSEYSFYDDVLILIKTEFRYPASVENIKKSRNKGKRNQIISMFCFICRHTFDLSLDEISPIIKRERSVPSKYILNHLEYMSDDRLIKNWRPKNRTHRMVDSARYKEIYETVIKKISNK